MEYIIEHSKKGTLILNKKINILLLATLVIIIIGSSITAYINMQKYTMETSLMAGNKELDNPARGFYVQLGSDSRSLLEEIREENVRLILIAFDIAAYRDCPISEEKLQELEEFLKKLDELQMQGIFRAAYGFSQADSNDADSMDRIEEHILQIAPVLNKYKRVIYCVQAGFLGPWGEWHTSKFLTGKSDNQIENRNQILKFLLDNLDSSILLNVRRPRFIRDAKNAGLDIDRIGCHNDGLLASTTDLGTYDDTDYNREAELLWLKNRLMEINGGEAPMLSEFTKASTAVQEFCDIQLSYLNKRYHLTVMEEWKKESINNENAYEYIKNHLGYRLYVSSICYYKTWRKGELFAVLENEGFAAVPRNYRVSFVLKDMENNKIEIPVNIKNIRELKHGEKITLQADIPKEFRKISLKIGLKIYDSEDNRNVVELSNQENEFIEGVNYLYQIIKGQKKILS